MSRCCPGSCRCSRRTLRRGPELSGAAVPASVLERLEPYADDPVAFRAAGMDVTGRAVRAAAGRGRAGGCTSTR